MEEIKEPYTNGFCAKCRNHFVLHEEKCDKHLVGMDATKCEEIKECKKFHEK